MGLEGVDGFDFDWVEYFGGGKQMGSGLSVVAMGTVGFDGLVDGGRERNNKKIFD